MATELAVKDPIPQSYQDVAVTPPGELDATVNAGVPQNAPGDDVRSKYEKLLNICRLLFWFAVIDCLFVLILSVDVRTYER